MERAARALLLGDFEVSGRGAVPLGALREEVGGTAVLSGLALELQGAGRAHAAADLCVGGPGMIDAPGSVH